MYVAKTESDDGKPCYIKVPEEVFNLEKAINEAIEIAKKYADDTAPSFVNGILNTIAKQKGLK